MYAALGTLGLVVSLLGLVFWWTRSAKRDGQTEAKLTFSQDTLKAIKDAKDAQDSVIIDITERERVRRKYDNA